MNIPNLPVGQLIDDNGNPTPVELLFRQNLIQVLQQDAGPEGLVCSPQDQDNIATIVANTDAQGNYTCQGGTLFYDTTNNVIKAVILVAGVPTLKTVTLS